MPAVPGLRHYPHRQQRQRQVTTIFPLHHNPRRCQHWRCRRVVPVPTPPLPGPAHVFSAIRVPVPVDHDYALQRPRCHVNRQYKQALQGAFHAPEKRSIVEVSGVVGMRRVRCAECRVGRRTAARVEDSDGLGSRRGSNDGGGCDEGRRSEGEVGDATAMARWRVVRWRGRARLVFETCAIGPLPRADGAGRCTRR